MATMDMRGLLRLAGWGCAAAGALLFAVVAAVSGNGHQRLLAEAQTRHAAELAQAAVANSEQLARLTATENDTRLLVELVRSLSNDRELLLGRVTVLERNLEDVTGSIRHQAKAAVAPHPQSSASAEEASPALPPSKIATTSAAASSPAPTAAPAEAPVAPAGDPPKRVASVAPVPPAPDPEPPRPAAGVEIGGAATFDGLRTLWGSLKTGHPGLFEGLHPIVTVRENTKSRAAELRLVAGPLTDVESAARICATLAASKRTCRLVSFEGQPLALTVPEGARRPGSPAPRPTPRPAP
ncbi:MAG: hypothetical protein IT538_15480 [Variibacter sp.]|nr:hypothetical protein [Variibacter sp.]